MEITWFRWPSDTSTLPSAATAAELPWLQSCTRRSRPQPPHIGWPGSVRLEAGATRSAGDRWSKMFQTIAAAPVSASQTPIVSPSCGAAESP